MRVYKTTIKVLLVLIIILLIVVAVLIDRTPRVTIEEQILVLDDFSVNKTQIDNLVMSYLSSTNKLEFHTVLEENRDLFEDYDKSILSFGELSSHGSPSDDVVMSGEAEIVYSVLAEDKEYYKKTGYLVYHARINYKDLSRGMSIIQVTAYINEQGKLVDLPWITGW